ncbi:MAG: hypothetical protein M1829_006555 [Trizodia sp. TS-e1964]|nr:MAG: hypothetical protein M1829_006555 [Trizodia sp. TS-e1964]
MSGLSGDAIIGIGVTTALISTCVQSLGLTLQRKSHILEDEKAPHDPRRPPHKRKRWLLGMGLFVVTNILGSTIQISTLPIPVLATLQASGLAFNSICASLILGEPFTRLSLGGTILVSCGAILIASYGSMTEPAHNLNELLVLLRQRSFVLWTVGTFLMISTILGGTKVLKNLHPRSKNTPRMRLYRGIAYGCVSGILSAHSLLVAKLAVELLIRTVVGTENQYFKWQSWMLLIGLVSLALTQLYFLHRGLKLVSTSVLYPLVFCIYNIIAILDGLVYFKQASRLGLRNALLIALGTVILLAGVLALSWRLGDDTNTTQATLPQGALTPGLGLVDSETDNEADHDLLTDEEGGPEETQQLLAPAGMSSAPQSPITKFPSFLSSNRGQATRSTESNEIWGELEDEDSQKHPSPLPLYHRRSSGPRSLFPQTQRRKSAGAVLDQAHEGSPLLKSHSGFSFAQRRRAKTGIFGVFRSRSRKGESQQDALGGWWKMKWWNNINKDLGSNATQPNATAPLGGESSQ